jgi:hypothetical protein
VRLGAALTLLVIVIAVVPRLFEPRTWMLLSAMRELGPISGWRCVESTTYAYDPNREQPDSTLLSAPPEAAVLELVRGVPVDTVEVDLSTGEAAVSTHIVGPESADERTVYVLSPGQLQAVTFEVGDTSATICNSHLSDWKIVGEQHLG